MSEAERDFDRRVPVPSNLIFEVHDDHDPTETRFLSAFVQAPFLSLALVEDVTCNVQATFSINSARCRELSDALLRAAEMLDRSEC